MVHTQRRRTSRTERRRGIVAHLHRLAGASERLQIQPSDISADVQ